MLIPQFIYRMKRIFLLTCLFSLLFTTSSLAQIVTNFYGRNTVQSDGYTGALYKVEIYNDQTHVTVELKPTKSKSRINYYSSRNTIIDCGSGVELPIVGFLRNGEIDTQPFSGTWGWSNVKVGESYRYTMVFAGRIPGGVTNFTLKDKGDYSGAHGFGFSNYTINNPDPCEHTGLTEYSIKARSDEDDDGIVGIYEGYNNNKYKLGVIKSGSSYKLVYLSGASRYPWWHVGDVKAVLRETATPGLYKADWYMRDKSVESNTYVGFDGGSMKVVIEGQDEDGYIKMYPTASSGRTSPGKASEWSGTGFALKNGYVVTNFHVVDGAKRIEVHGVNGNSSSNYTADVIATDKNNDLAIIKINDSRFNGFGTIPYAIKSQMVDVGEDVWVLGYPLTQYLGNEIKLTNGVVSSRSGFQGDVATYQITAPVQPGNSGGPLFDSKGNVVGIVNAGVPGAENVGYAIKTSYLKNLADSYSLSSYLPSNNTISTLSLKDQVKSVNNYVFMLICSSKAGSSYSSSSSSSYTSGSSRTGSSGSTSSGYTGSSSSSTTGSSSSSHSTSSSSPTMIDLGLSVKWADRNVGAASSESVGEFFSWGETKSKSEFKRDNYQWFKDNQYSNPGGLSDISGSSYDPAKSSFGGSWRMPTEAEIEELITKCTWTWTTTNGVQGYKVTGKNGNSIFLPANGEKTEDHTPTGSYWSSESNPSAAYFSYILHFEKGKKECVDDLRESFGAIRPVSGSKTQPKTNHRKADDAYALAVQRFSQNDFTGAFEEADKAIRIMPNGTAHYFRGYLALYYLRDYDAAKTSFSYCIKNNYRATESRLLYAHSLSRNDENDAAIKQYDEYLKEHQTKDEAYADAMYHRANAYSDLENWTASISDLKKLLECEGKVDFDYGTVYNNIAWAYLNLNQLNNAKEPIKKALKLNHNEGYIWDTDGELQYKLGNYEQCIISMNNAIAIYKADGDRDPSNSYYYRGLAKLKTGNLAGAYVDLEKASDLGVEKAAEELGKIDAATIDYSETGAYRNKITREISATGGGTNSKIVQIELTEESTIIYMSYTNTQYDTGGWYSISPDAYIRDKSTGKKYELLTAQNCAISPRSTSIAKGETATFTLVFPALPKDVSKIDFVESEDSTWKFYNIELK